MFIKFAFVIRPRYTVQTPSLFQIESSYAYHQVQSNKSESAMYVSPASQHIVELSSLHIAHMVQHCLTQPMYSSKQSQLLTWVKDYGVGKTQVPYVLHALKQTLMCQVVNMAYIRCCFSSCCNIISNAEQEERVPGTITHFGSELRIDIFMRILLLVTIAYLI